VFVTVDVKLIPPLSFFLNVKLGGVLFNLGAVLGARCSTVGNQQVVEGRKRNGKPGATCRRCLLVAAAPTPAPVMAPLPACGMRRPAFAALVHGDPRPAADGQQPYVRARGG